MALLKDNRDFWTRPCELSIWYGAGIVYDLGRSVYFTADGRGGLAYQFVPKNALRLLDLHTQVVKILADTIRPFIWRFVQKNALDIDASGLVLRPASIDRHILVDLLQRSFAVL